VDEREAQIGRLNSTVVALQEQIESLGREKQALEGNLNERSARLEALTGAIADLESSIRRASDLTRPF
jgi:peptidoglycan hydrolase CwlO-like protein